MGCKPSKKKENRKNTAGYFAVACKFRNIVVEEKPKKKQEPAKAHLETGTDTEVTTNKEKQKKLSVPLFRGGLSSGFGQFETLFSRKVEEDKKTEKPKPVSKVMDMTFVYHVPRSKININPYSDDPRNYTVSSGRVTGLKDTDYSTKEIMHHFKINS